MENWELMQVLQIGWFRMIFKIGMLLVSLRLALISNQELCIDWGLLGVRYLRNAIFPRPRISTLRQQHEVYRRELYDKEKEREREREKREPEKCLECVSSTYNTIRLGNWRREREKKAYQIFWRAILHGFPLEKITVAAWDAQTNRNLQHPVMTYFQWSLSMIVLWSNLQNLLSTLNSKRVTVLIPLQ